MNNLNNALLLMLIGMIMLFIFFCLLYALLRMYTWIYPLLARYTRAPTAGAPPDRTVPAPPDSLPAVIAAALHHFRNRH